MSVWVARCVVVLGLLVAAGRSSAPDDEQPPPPPPPPSLAGPSSLRLSTARRQQNLPGVSEFTRAYIGYSIFYRNFDLVVNNNGDCPLYENITSIRPGDESSAPRRVEEDRCASPTYRPRWVDSTMVTWRHVQHEEEEEEEGGGRGDYSDSNSDYQNNTMGEESDLTSPLADEVDAGAGGSEGRRGSDARGLPRRKRNTSSTSVHPLLAIALLLPHHPPSLDMYNALRALGPMFPSVQFVVGDAVEFQDLPLLSEFPQLLLFAAGSLSGRFAGRPSKLADLGAQIASWANEPPRAEPVYYLAPEAANFIIRPEEAVGSPMVAPVILTLSTFISKFLRFSSNSPRLLCHNHFGCAPSSALLRLEALVPPQRAHATGLSLGRLVSPPPTLWPLEPVLPWAYTVGNKAKQLFNASLQNLPTLILVHIAAMAYAVARLTLGDAPHLFQALF